MHLLCHMILYIEDLFVGNGAIRVLRYKPVCCGASLNPVERQSALWGESEHCEQFVGFDRDDVIQFCVLEKSALWIVSRDLKLSSSMLWGQCVLWRACVLQSLYIYDSAFS